MRGGAASHAEENQGQRADSPENGDGHVGPVVGLAAYFDGDDADSRRERGQIEHERKRGRFENQPGVARSDTRDEQADHSNHHKQLNPDDGVAERGHAIPADVEADPGIDEKQFKGNHEQQNTAEPDDGGFARCQQDHGASGGQKHHGGEQPTKPIRCAQRPEGVGKEGGNRSENTDPPERILPMRCILFFGETLGQFSLHAEQGGGEQAHRKTGVEEEVGCGLI